MVVLSLVPRGRTTKVDCDDRNQLKLKDLARLGEVRAILTSLESEAVRDFLIYEISIKLIFAIFKLHKTSTSS